MTRKVLLITLLSCATSLAADAQEFQSLFNGNDLTGWAGRTEFWSVKDGAILGKTTAENPLKAHTFLVWEGGEVEDFVFKAKVRFGGNNSGIQYRSNLVNRTDFTVKGYQADLHPNPEFFGMLFGRGKIARRWQRVEVAADGTSKVLGEVGDKNQELVSMAWNELTIIAVGNRLIHQINGINTVDVTDNHPAAKQKGILAVQLHVGAPMTIELKDIRLRHLKGAEAKATIQAASAKRKKAPPKKTVALPTHGFDKAKWIWHVKPATTAGARLRTRFELNGAAKSAVLHATCDNAARIYVNGKQVATNSHWKKPVTVDIARYLKPRPRTMCLEAAALSPRCWCWTAAARARRYKATGVGKRQRQGVRNGRRLSRSPTMATGPGVQSSRTSQLPSQCLKRKSLTRRSRPRTSSCRRDSRSPGCTTFPRQSRDRGWG